MAKTKSRRIFGIALILASIASLYFVPWLLVKAWILPISDNVQEELERAVEHGFEGVITYVDIAGKEPEYYAAGWHNRDTKEPANPQALFKLASISKLYNAVAVTKLVGDERLSLDRSLAEYLPELWGRIDYANEISLRMLIKHESGIPNYTDVPDFWANPERSYQENLDLILDKPANFKPGEEYEYCNTNYLLLNKIMDNELGYGNFGYVKEVILKPLNLHNTYSSLNEVDMDNLMSGYHLGYPDDLKADDLGLVATAEDVGVFLRALNEGSLFEGEEEEIYASLYKYEHSGWVPGYQSFASYNEELDAIFVEFYSTTDADLLYWNLAEIINSRIVRIVKRQEAY